MWRVITSITGLMRWSAVIAILVSAMAGDIGKAYAVQNQPPAPVLIVAIQTGGIDSAGQEFIRLANTTAQPVDLEGVRLEYFAANPKSFIMPSRTILLGGSVQAGQEYLVATANVGESADHIFSATLAAAGGHLRLIGSDKEWDFVGWGTAAGALGRPALAPPAGQAIYRRQQAGIYQNTTDNSQDFTTGIQLDGTTNNQDYSGLQITELLPDPVAPVTDAEGEYIEIFNGGVVEVQTEGLRLVSGQTTTKSFSLPVGEIAPGQYLTYFAPQSKLSLGNSGGRVRLQAADGMMLDEVSYDKAQAGESWARHGDGWRWTKQPTPGQANTISVASQEAAAAKLAAKKTTKKTGKPLAKKTPKTGAVKSSSTDKPATTTTTSTSRMPLHNGVVAGVGGLAVLYGAYEYRHDVINFYRKLRRNREAG